MDPQQRMLLEVTYEAFENGESASFSARLDVTETCTLQLAFVWKTWSEVRHHASWAIFLLETMKRT